ncbi:MAG: thioredoxin family protein [Methanomassiliicoccus sp.]|nr:thioredoxin family protein [Methanomassiliicoccus sp.]
MTGHDHPPTTDPIDIGEKAPPFPELLGVDGNTYSSSMFASKKALVILFMANRCTTAQAYTERIDAIQRDYADLGVQVIAINSDDPSRSPSETYLEMVLVAKERNYSFPYLKDEDQAIARSYGAELTLHAFLLDQDRRVRYRGRVDDSPNPGFVRSNDLRNALDDVLAGKEVRVKETRPFPCGVDKFVLCPSCGSRLDL